jgi:hypothetical protein
VQLLGEVFNLAWFQSAQTASTMGGAPSRVLMDDLGSKQAVVRGVHVLPREKLENCRSARFP